MNPPKRLLVPAHQGEQVVVLDGRREPGAEPVSGDHLVVLNHPIVVDPAEQPRRAPVEATTPGRSWRTPEPIRTG
ncbi:hypothetical protein [Dactylosporangium sp. NPDC006015]|uniref:hypothetical protein n=1 Tax=Dactylosporangium sp. NPDC006015 TaxID=3154576 RepID=UPI0033B43B85